MRWDSKGRCGEAEETTLIITKSEGQKETKRDGDAMGFRLDAEGVGVRSFLLGGIDKLEKFRSTRNA